MTRRAPSESGELTGLAFAGGVGVTVTVGLVATGAGTARCATPALPQPATSTAEVSNMANRADPGRVRRMRVSVCGCRRARILIGIQSPENPRLLVDLAPNTAHTESENLPAAKGKSVGDQASGGSGVGHLPKRTDVLGCTSGLCYELVSNRVGAVIPVVPGR
jgi:hypothetical protein